MIHFRKIFSLFLIIILFSLFGCNSNNAKEQLSDSIPKDFNFILNYGIESKNQLDSIKGQYTKDMISDPPLITDLKLSNDELNLIYSQMKKINILNYPENFNPKGDMMQTPFKTYSIKIIFDGKEKNIHWKDENASQTKEATQLREIFNKVHEMIIKKDEYKKIPQARGGYE